MKKIFLAIVFAVAGHARADVFSDYQKVGTEALEMAFSPDLKAEEFVAKMQELVVLGYQIMDLYQAKYVDCAQQYAEIKAMDPMILSMSYAEMDEKLHDGKGLLVAPKACYKGRSMIVHPYQMAAFAIEGTLQSHMEDVDHELNEVIHRAVVIKKDLGL